jgi:hypothetical protein
MANSFKMTPLGVGNMFQYWYQYVSAKENEIDVGMFRAFLFERVCWLVLYSLEFGSAVAQMDCEAR